MPDFENPISQFCSVPIVERLAMTHGCSSAAMNVSSCSLASVGLSAYHGSAPNDGAMTVRFFWFWAFSDCTTWRPSPKLMPSRASTGSV